VDDFNLEFLDNNKFELIHQRELLGCVPDWPAFYRKCFNALTPGGWIDISEPDTNGYYSAANDDKLMDEVAGKDHPLGTFSRQFSAACKAAGMEGDIAPKLEGWLKDAGFVNVTVNIHKVPVGTWPKNKKQKEIGAWNLLLLQTGLEGIYMRLLCTQLGLVIPFSMSEELTAVIVGPRKRFLCRLFSPSRLTRDMTGNFTD
jgi:hypothetical protein